MGDGQAGAAVTVTISIAWIEGRNLLLLIDEFIGLVEGPRSPADPALARLTPIAYPDDDVAAAEFRRGTSDQLLDRRRRDAEEVRADLAGFAGEQDDSRDVLEAHEVVLAAARVDPWLRTLAAIRLVVASRLGIDRDDRHAVDDPRFHVYDWLGYRLEDLIQRADAIDQQGTSSATE